MKRERLKEYYYFAMWNRRDFKYPQSKAGMNSVMPIAIPRRNKSGVPAREALSIFESQGRIPLCKEPRLLYRLMAGKAWRDWHITEWARGVIDGITTLNELRESGVLESLIESVNKARWSILARNA